MRSVASPPAPVVPGRLRSRNQATVEAIPSYWHAGRLRRSSLQVVAEMPSPDTGYSLSADERGVAPLIGFILLFGLLVTAFAGYQATAVPQQNADTEFQHFQDVQDDMIVVRNSISTAGQADTEQFESVQLGATYRERVLALNPPAAAGSLRTSDAYDITVGGDTVSSTRFLTYRNGYNEFEVGPIRYENSVVYLDERDDDGDGNVVILEEQNLVEDGELRITTLQNEYQESGVGEASIDIYPVDVENADDLAEYEGEITVEVPTRLTAGDYWDDALGEEDVYGGVEENGYEDGVHRLTFNANVNDISFNTVGIDSAPEDEAGALKRGVGDGRGDGNGENGDGGETECEIDESGNANVEENETIDSCIRSGGDVDVGENATTQDIDADGSVDVRENATTLDITAGESVDVMDNASTWGINAGGSVDVDENATTRDITAGESVDVEENATTQDIDAGGDVTVYDDAETGGITSGEEVDIRENVTVTKGIVSDGTVTVGANSTVQGDISVEDGDVDLGDNTTVEGDIFVDNAEDIECGEGSKINGKGCSGYKNSNY